VDVFFEGLGGLVDGGHGEFSTTNPPGCNLIVTESGLIDSLDLVLAVWEGTYKAGLFQNDITPVVATALSEIVPATFSGYAGEQVTFSWDAAVMAGVRAVTQAAALIWTHNGGPIQNWIFGYYLVSQSNTLIFAERFCPAPLPMATIGQRIRMRPRFRLGSEFPE